MSVKQRNIQTIALTTGGTVTISQGTLTNPMLTVPTFDDIATEYMVTGTQSLASNFVIAMATPADGIVIEFYWRARATIGAFGVTILGKLIPADYVLSDFNVKFVSTGGSFEVVAFNLDLTKTAQLPGNRLTNASVGTTQLTDKTVTYAKVQDVTAYSVPVRAFGTDGVLASLAMAANSIIARVAGNIVNLAVTTNGHVLKQTGGALGFSAFNFNELAGTLAKAQIPDKEISLAKMASTGMLSSQTVNTGTTAVTTEEVLFIYTIPAGLIANTGEGVNILVAGTTAANGHTKTIKVKVGGNIYATNSVTTAPNGKNWFAQIRVLRAGAAAAVGQGSLVVDNAHEGVTIDSTGLTWANALNVEVTGQNGTATINDIVVSFVSVTLIR